MTEHTLISLFLLSFLSISSLLITSFELYVVVDGLTWHFSNTEPYSGLVEFTAGNPVIFSTRGAHYCALRFASLFYFTSSVFYNTYAQYPLSLLSHTHVHSSPLLSLDDHPQSART